MALALRGRSRNMERLEVGQVINTKEGLEKIVAMEWGNPVTIAVESLNSVAREPRSMTQEGTEALGDTDSQELSLESVHKQ